MAWYKVVMQPRLISPHQTPTIENNTTNIPLNLSGKKDRRKTGALAHGHSLRQPNWTEEEKQILMEEFKRHRVILDGGNDRQAKREKREAWEAVRHKVLQVSKCTRTLKEVRKKWHNICFYDSKRKLHGISKRPTMPQVTTVVLQSQDQVLKQIITGSSHAQANTSSSSFAGSAAKLNDVTDCDEMQSKYMNLAAAEIDDQSEKNLVICNETPPIDSSDNSTTAAVGLAGGSAQTPSSSAEDAVPDSVRMQRELMYLRKERLELERRRINLEIDILEVDRKRVRIEEEMINRKRFGCQTTVDNEKQV